MELEFIPIDYDYFDFQGRNYVKIIGRNNSGKRVCVIDSCDVYLWAILKDNLKKEKINKLIKKIKKIELDLKGRKTKVENVELHEKNFLGKRVNALKVFATNYKDLHDIADKLIFPEIEKRRGYDIGFITHYIIEKKINPLSWYEISGDLLNNSQKFGGIDMNLDVDLCIHLKSSKKIEDKKFSPKVLCYDIETDEIAIGKGEILMVSLVGEKFKKVITWKKPHKASSEIEVVKDESELIEKFVEYVRKISPDFLVGYYSDGFDLPYFKARAEKLRINLNLGLDNSQPKFSRGAMLTGKIFGIVHIDLLRFIRTAYAQYMQSESLSLNEVAKEFLNDEKKDFGFKHSSKIKENEWDEYFAYNLQDSQLVKNLFEKFWPDILEFVKTTGEPVSEITRAGLSKYTESYVLHNLYKFNEIPEKRPTHDEISKRRYVSVEGAFVFEPTPGLYENIAMFDFTSMHTSIIITHNLSKSTFLEKHTKPKDSHKSPEINENGKKIQYYFTKKPGFFPELMKEIFELRKKAKEEYKKNPNIFTKARSNAFKVLSASAHGYIAFFGARYYSHEASASILAFVRKYNKETIGKVQKEGYKVIFGDTDSVAFVMDGKSKTDVKKLLEKLNKELPGVMHLELEDFYKRGLWVTTRAGNIGAKKKYALIDENNKLKIRGFETVRRDWCGLARKVQNNVLKQILEDGNEKKSLEYVKETIKKIKAREVNKEDLMIKTQLKKPISEYKAISPHVIAARKMEEKKIPIDQGN
ncbi:MAG: DNA polymerase domain-containing protein, partial [Nanoarchaeota archaeon]|nr:DNA polymerase domain-containing protein [Nanoarchaeota archaeon]